jgi:arylsulfatase A-like enzyme
MTFLASDPIQLVPEIAAQLRYTTGMKHILTVCLFFFLAFLAPCTGGAAEVSKPNVIVIFTDDHGWADLGAQGVRKDIRTPNLDSLAAGGLRASNGYVTAPQCVPSRSGLLTGRYQNLFRVESNREPLDGFDQQATIAERLKKVGYATGMSGKWHLGPTNAITQHGFDDVFCNQGGGGRAWANFDLEGNTIPGTEIRSPLYHLDANSAAACAFIKRHAQEPFFFYLAYRGPHTPLDAPPKYTSRFPGEMPERRRQALAMISAIDDGVGRVMETLRAHKLEERTLIFFMGDNGAPLKIHQTDSPLNADAGGWDGSLNEPLNGEKGMLSEGGIRVPWLAHWKGRISPGQVFEHPVISLDIAATIVALAGIETQPGELDGVNLLPHFRGENRAAPHDAIFWRWIAQSAIREGQWKLLVGGSRSYLFDVVTDPGEKHNLIKQHPEIAKRLRGRLEAWSGELQPPGLDIAPMARIWEDYFDYYLDGKAPSASVTRDNSESTDWIARNATAAVKQGALHITPVGNRQKPFIAFANLQIPGPAIVTASARASKGGIIGVSWRLLGQNGFVAGQMAQQEFVVSGNFQDVTFDLPAEGSIIQLRLHLPAGITDLRRFEIKSANGDQVKRWRFE